MLKSAANILLRASMRQIYLIQRVINTCTEGSVKIKNLLIIIASLFIAFNSFAVEDLILKLGGKKKTENGEVKENYIKAKLSGAVATRGIHLGSTEDNLAQTHVTVKLAVDVNGAFEIVGIGRTGETYGGNWDSFANSGADTDYEPTFDLRNLFIQKLFAEKYMIQVGALPTKNGLLRSGGFSGTGWVDGVRANAATDFGLVEVTAGSISDLKNPDAFSRDREFNYVELKLSQKLFDNLVYEAAVEQYDDEFFFKGGANYDVEIDPNRMVKVILETIVDTEGEFKTIMGLEADPVELITGEDSSIKVRVSWQHVSDEFDLASRPATSFWTQPGETLMIEASGSIHKEWGVSWFAQARLNEDSERSYGIVGLKWSF